MSTVIKFRIWILCSSEFTIQKPSIDSTLTRILKLLESYNPNLLQMIHARIVIRFCDPM